MCAKGPSPAALVRRVNQLIAAGRHGRLFAVVHFAGHQWKVTPEDLILIDNELDIACGERIRLEKVRLSVSLCLRGLSHQTWGPWVRGFLGSGGGKTRGQESE